ncbi:hypothetical protein [Caldithrix abyssi]
MLKYFLPSKTGCVFLLLIWGALSLPGYLTAGNTFFIVHKNNLQDESIDSLKLSPVTQIGDVLIFKAYDESPSIFEEKNFSCTFLPLAQPMDSILQVLFRASRTLKSGAFLLNFDDRFQVKALIDPAFRAAPLPLKEINMIVSPKIIQNEIYIDVDIHALISKEIYDFRQILFFEFLFQKFLLERIARGRAYSESIFSVLFKDYRPVYEPELHFYLDEKAIMALIEKWAKIKTAFQEFVYSDKFSLLTQEFNKKLEVIQSSDYNRLIGFSKLISRYGYFFPPKQIRIVTEKIEEQQLRSNIAEISEHLIMLWFKPGPLDSKTLETLKSKSQQQNILIIQE